MSEKLSERIETWARTVGLRTIGGTRLMEAAQEVATLERQLAEALAEPTTQEMVNAGSPLFEGFTLDDLALLVLVIAARRRRIMGEASHE